jgi:hypothetical protein
MALMPSAAIADGIALLLNGHSLQPPSEQCFDEIDGVHGVIPSNHPYTGVQYLFDQWIAWREISGIEGQDLQIRADRNGDLANFVPVLETNALEFV